MRTVSSTWKQIFNEPNHLTDVKIEIDGVDYGMDDLYAVNQERTVYSGRSPEVGACIASSLSFDIVPKGRVPRMAEVTLYNRLATWDRSSTSEWLVMGTYFIDTRSKIEDGLKMRFTAYDSMLKCDLPYIDNTSFDEWPQSEDDVVEDIADAIGVEVDSRTELAGYDVPYPNDYTMREVLGYIGAANGGNWIITPENKLLLVKLTGESSLLAADHSTAILFGDSIIVLSTGYEYGDSVSSDIKRNAQGFHNLGLLQPFTGVKVWYNRENSYVDQEVEVEGETTTEKVEVENAYFAGDNSGRVLELDCPWGTQAMADAILVQIEGMMYQGATVDAAQIDPAAELGDTVICDGIGFSLSSISVSYTGDYLPTIGAPADEEVDYEYHYESQTERKLSRKVSLGDSYYGFKVTRENGIEVVNIVDGNETTRMILNSSIQAFYNANGDEALYFDAEAGQYKFVGDVTVLSGSLNINNNFIVDTEGNVTTNGNVTLQGGNTVIKAPNIYGGAFYNAAGNARLEIGSDLSFYSSITVNNPLFTIYDTAGSVDLQFYGRPILTYVDDIVPYTNAKGKWSYTGSGQSGDSAEVATIGDFLYSEDILPSVTDVTAAGTTVTLSKDYDDYSWLILYGYAGGTNAASRFLAVLPTVALGSSIHFPIASGAGTGYARISASGRTLTFVSQSYSSMRIDYVYGKR